MICRRQFPSKKNEKIARAKNALRRLRANPRDAVAAMEFYETSGLALQEVAARYFGNNKLGKKAVLNLLAGVISRAWSYDSQCMNASEWVSRVADSEARKLRAALDSASSKGRDAAGAV